jgi:CBS domain containing-hemolysin-like protein
MILLALYVLANLAGSFFCSMSEAALLASSEARIRARVEAGDPHAARLLRLKIDPGRTLASIVFLNNVFAIAGTAVITAVATDVIHTAPGMAVFIAAQTLLIICFGEILPKLLGEALPEPIAGRVAPALVALRRLLTPLTLFVHLVVSWARPRIRVALGREEEIRQLARLGEERGHIASAEAELIQRVFRLDDITVTDVMTPRPLVRGFRAGATLDEVREELLRTRHYQFPVYEQDLDKVTGVLQLRDALAALARGEGTRTIGELQKPALFLPTSRPVDLAFRDLQAAHGRLAVVLDEYGVTEGILTMDDLTEELVGEAIDEADVSAGLAKRLSKDAALVHGLMRVRDVARFLKVPAGADSLEEEHMTVSGLLLQRLDRVPLAGDSLDLEEGLRLEVKVADERGAQRVLARSLRHGAPAG